MSTSPATRQRSPSRRTAQRPTSPAWDAGTVTPINVSTNTAGTPIDVGADPVAIAITPDGSATYVRQLRIRQRHPHRRRHQQRRHHHHRRRRTTVRPRRHARRCDRLRRQLLNGERHPDQRRIQHHRHTDRGRRRPARRGHHPDGATAYVANSFSGDVTPIDTATGTAGDPIAVGTNPTAIAITPDQAPRAAGTANVAPVGSEHVRRVRVDRGVRHHHGTPGTSVTAPPRRPPHRPPPTPTQRPGRTRSRSP